MRWARLSAAAGLCGAAGFVGADRQPTEAATVLRVTGLEVVNGGSGRNLSSTTTATASRSADNMALDGGVVVGRESHGPGSLTSLEPEQREANKDAIAH
jgi:hypothetical protein